MKDLWEEICSLYRWIVRFITEDIWRLELDDLGRAKRKFLKYLKIAIMTVRESGINKLGLYSVSLSFFVAMSVVPFAAVAFAVTGGLGFEETLKSLLLDNFSDNQEVINWVIRFADNIVESGQKDIFGVISFIFFTWIIIWLILNIEKSFNVIWNVERRRPLAKRFLYYLGILVTAPLIITMLLSLFSIFSRNSQTLGYLSQWGLLFVIMLFFLTIMYKYIPNVKVHFSAAFNAAVIASIVFIIIQYIYTETQMLVSRIDAVYGAFAAIPLFLIWLNISWMVILIGAEISHAFQYVSEYRLKKNEV
ncbi:MAG: YihY/virulence factor BrkB family protein [Bacteroidetes bacterium]|uniref:YihY/virulence factor BrkB family protein n=1 Tax=Candidatus Egerieousia excrementavium TaxID=2840778 RepID=A0A9D9DML1_9BACT|nr:YihY/virulence factor BrkB family protein [Candidatus Egerieousia excrementavium]